MLYFTGFSLKCLMLTRMCTVHHTATENTVPDRRATHTVPLQFRHSAHLFVCIIVHLVRLCV